MAPAQIFPFPKGTPLDQVFARRARKAIRDLIAGNIELGPMMMYGPYADSVSLVRWARVLSDGAVIRAADPEHREGQAPRS